MRGRDRFENVIDKVNTMSANCFDETLPVMDMRFDSLERMYVAGMDVEVLPRFQSLSRSWWNEGPEVFAGRIKPIFSPSRKKGLRRISVSP